MIETIGLIFASTIGALIQREIRYALRLVALGVVSGAFLVGVVAFLSVAVFFWLRLFFPPIEAALLSAAALLVVAILGVLLLVLTSRRWRVKRSAIAEEIAPLVDILKATGCHAEAAALLAGAQLATRARPYYLVVIAVLAGVTLGRKLDPTRPPEK